MLNLNSLFIKATDFISIIIYNSGLIKYGRPLSDLRLVFYHGIGKNESPCFRYLNDEVAVKIFEFHIDYLMKNYNILSLRDALDEINKEPIQSKSPICSISFDDGLRSVYEKAFPILKKRNIPATVFLNTAVIGNTNMTWLHLINYLLTEFGIKKVSSLFNRFKQDHLRAAPVNETLIQEWYKQYYEINYENKLLYNVLEHLNLSLSEIAKEQKVYLNWEEIDEMENYNITFSSHTQNHTPLARFANEYHIENEICGAYDTLCHCGKNLEFVSFPFGMEVDYGKKAVKCAFDAGHKYVIEVGAGTNDLDRVKEYRILARVGLGSVDSNRSNLFSAIEMRPKWKTLIKRYI